MKQIKLQPLTREEFAPFGEFYTMTSPDGYPLCGAIHKFYPDRLTTTCQGRLAFSPLVVRKPEKMVITQQEYHTSTEELLMPQRFTAGPIYHTDTYGEGDTLSLAGQQLQVIKTPGHTQGSVCLLCEDTLFSGDTLFAGTCGRTDLPGGDYQTILSSLRRLSSLEGDYQVLPGHGRSSTLAQERIENPYLQLC